MANKKARGLVITLAMHKCLYIHVNTYCKFCLFYFQTLDMESMSRYVSPINPAVFPHLTVVLLGIGIFFMAWFFVYPLHQILYY